ncbi:MULTISPECIES: response regulator transcription factor [unclassified Flavobacterium]|uniref:response regulator transcription factor n=1 Tax=unclassified Flavobacterium TaxID=196869 RepID=UPI000F0CC2E4|nr:MULTISPECIES: response regulator transcription factor [unclassified Flavobacterium]AYN04000.1 DNA-binding response regulator [Flavobacterium sp. 140616W15]MCD0476506.1 response regulator transcription factor [Flavobacterium sp. EDS]
MRNFLIADSENLHIIGLKQTLKKFVKKSSLTVVGSKDELIIHLEKNTVEYLIIDPNNIFLFYDDDFKQLRLNSPNCKIIILSYFKNKQTISSFLKENINGFISKDCQEQTIFDALYKIENGERYLCPQILNILVDVLISPASDLKEKLTFRESEILKQIAKGNDGKSIASNLFISIHTFRTHRKNIMKKTGRHTTPELILYAIDRKLI